MSAPPPSKKVKSPKPPPPPAAKPAAIVPPPKSLPPQVIDAGPTRLRMTLYNSIRIPTTGIMPLSDIAAYALQHYALFVWLVTHAQPDFLDGPTEADVSKMISDANNTLLSKLLDKGPSSILLILKGGYTKTPLQAEATATERLILLAIIAERPQLIGKILAIFPETADPLRLTALLQPFTNPNLDSYASMYAEPPAASSLLSSLPATGLLRALYSVGRVRVMQNLLLRDAIQVRYAIAAILVDPKIFSVASLGEAEGLLTKIDNTLLANKDLYLPLQDAVTTLRNNYNKVKGLLSTGEAITQDAVRRLRLILGVVNASDALFDKLAPK